ncbi:4a-hydroxytetrahydrobiopterin dehydratase [Flagellimonas iocasae]|uniref:Putative pterin-4-alpha-carbinolamine dehydratase n=1 Tax=Flagellimonas iocasae TaxID=2055905 RepID=A0ABW4XUH3_9FLAO
MKKLSNTEITNALKELPGWSHQEDHIEKSFKFMDFKEAFSIMTRIAFECEQQNHHPNWENVYNNLTIKLNTHDAGGVTEKDIRLAQTIESIVNK